MRATTAPLQSRLSQLPVAVTQPVPLVTAQFQTGFAEPQPKKERLHQGIIAPMEVNAVPL